MNEENQDDIMNTAGGKSAPGEPTMKQKQIIADVKNKTLGLDTSRNKNSLRVGLAE
jgi:hypothetical protein